LRQLDRHLTDGLAKVYLVAGDETLLVDEALEQIRVAAKRADFAMRELHAADRSFRWAELAAGTDNLSLFASRKIVEIRLATPNMAFLEILAMSFATPQRQNSAKQVKHEESKTLWRR